MVSNAARNLQMIAAVLFWFDSKTGFPVRYGLDELFGTAMDEPGRRFVCAS